MDEKALRKFCDKHGLIYVPPIDKQALHSGTKMADLHASNTRASNIAAFYASKASGPRIPNFS